MDKHHLFMIFRFCSAVLSNVVLLSSLNVTSKCQCIISTDQCSLTVLANFCKQHNHYNIKQFMPNLFLLSLVFD